MRMLTHNRLSVTPVTTAELRTIFAMAEADTCCAPGYCAVTLGNASAVAPAFLFIADETPLHRKLGVYETRN